MATPILSGNSYYEIVATPTSNLFTLNPIDNNGNLFPNVTIVVDTTLVRFTLNLPSISIAVDPNEPTVNNSLGFNLTIVKSTTDINAVNVFAYGDDTIGGGTNIQLTKNSCAILSPASTKMWSALITTNI